MGVGRAKTMKVRDIMVAPVVVVGESTSLQEVAQTMLDRSIGCVAVVDGNGDLTGIITESDFTGRERGFPFSAYRLPKVFGEWFGKDDVERVHQAARDRKAREIMTGSVVTTREDETVTDLVKRMIERDLKRIPVVRDKRPIGMVTRHDLLKLMARADGAQT
jgi:CBS domain-containing protein